LVTTVHYQILEVNWRDIQALYRLEKACFGRDAWPLLDIVAVTTLPGVVRLKAVVDEQLVGFIAGEAKPKEGLGWILTLGSVRSIGGWELDERCYWNASSA